ncbi:MAG: hypothetical protein IPM50_07965 [Acidobacteriota bacterium]|nr:MAG: hypothetical protein IPM50_07965 [Acidobacteriota bacterium]
MKRIFSIVALALAVGISADPVIGQNQRSKADYLKEIAALSNTKQPEDGQKAYELAKEFLARFGNETKDANVKKVRAWKDAYRMDRFFDATDARNYDKAFALGAEILAEKPESVDVMLNLAYSGYMSTGGGIPKHRDDAVKYARNAMSLMGAGKLPESFAPFSNQAEASAYMHFIDGSLSMEKEPKQAAENIYKSLQYESQLKNDPLPYYLIAAYYEDVQASLSSALKAKAEKNTMSDAEFKAENDKVAKAIDLLMDAYARVIKRAEDQKHPNLGEWKARLEQIYEFKNKTKEGLPEFMRFANTRPLADPSKF